MLSPEHVSLVAGPNGLVMMAADRTRMVGWSLAPSDWVDEACLAANRPLSKAELATYFAGDFEPLTATLCAD